MQLLLALHREGMTLVMVTHDVSLKNLADRVVWMRDGLVAKDEQIAQEKREEAMRRLDDSIALKSLVVEKDRTVVTERRAPSDYAPIQFQMEFTNHN